jgi:hypothetical protein
MNAMHYAVFFDASEVVDALAEQTPSLVMGACSEFNNGNSLHIAAANLSLDSAKILVSSSCYDKRERNVLKQVFDVCF